MYLAPDTGLQQRCCLPPRISTEETQHCLFVSMHQIQTITLLSNCFLERPYVAVCHPGCPDGPSLPPADANGTSTSRAVGDGQATADGCGQQRIAAGLHAIVTMEPALLLSVNCRAIRVQYTSFCSLRFTTTSQAPMEAPARRSRREQGHSSRVWAAIRRG